ncbi:hypothetical protein BRC89_11360 [Halobacteriales archaeon QS_4_70_19]|nr:MAG: hypothetical protein BRC89_11360 [Halobacteriales archaeon QS_4_70_19]
MGNADDEAERRQHERASTVEDVLGEVREDLGEQAYPMTSEALVREFERGGVVDRTNAAERATWSEERVDDERPPADEGGESGREQSMERARQAQQADASDAEEANDE